MKETLLKKRIRRNILFAVCAAFCIIVLVYLFTGNYGPGEKALLAMKGTQDVAVGDYGNYISFEPYRAAPDTGFIFYPGGKVDSRAYASMMQQIAQSGTVCFIVKMPFDLAVFNIGGADEVINNYPGIQNWYIGGHSLGGVMACEWAKKNTDKIKGIVLWASYPNSDLSGSGLRCLSITAGKDGLLSQTKYDQAKALLPESAEYRLIEGGNHSQFGDYGLQKGDGSATISATEQEKAVAEETSKLLK